MIHALVGLNVSTERGVFLDFLCVKAATFLHFVLRIKIKILKSKKYFWEFGDCLFKFMIPIQTFKCVKDLAKLFPWKKSSSLSLIFAGKLI